MLVLAAVIIAAASLVVSHILVRDLAIEERNRMEVWAEAMRSLSTAEENTDLNLVLKVINENNTIPVIVTDEQGNVQTFRNVEIDAKNYEDILVFAQEDGWPLLLMFPSAVARPAEPQRYAMVGMER